MEKILLKRGMKNKKTKTSKLELFLPAPPNFLRFTLFTIDVRARACFKILAPSTEHLQIPCFVVFETTLTSAGISLDNSFFSCAQVIIFIFIKRRKRVGKIPLETTRLA